MTTHPHPQAALSRDFVAVGEGGECSAGSAGQGRPVESARTVRSKLWFSRGGAVLTLVAGASIATSAGVANASVVNSGAIAVSMSSGATGTAWNWATIADAEASAENACGYSDCNAVVYFTNACGAVSQAADGSWGWAWAPSLAVAENMANGFAINQMHADGYSWANARVITWACTDGHQ